MPAGQDVSVDRSANGGPIAANLEPSFPRDLAAWDLFSHGAGEGNGESEVAGDILGGHFPVLEEAVMQCTDQGLFNFRAAEPVAAFNKLVHVEFLRFSVAQRKVNAKNVAPFRIVRQIDKKYFVESPLAEQFRRKCANVVCRCDYKHRRTLLRHPR